MSSRPEDHGGSIGYVYLLAVVAALGGLLFGYDTAVISGAIGYLSKHFSLSAHGMGWAASCALVGCIFGAAGAGMLSDWLGRKKVLMIAALLFTVSAVGAAVPRDLWELVVARLLGGLAIGAASMLSPLYIAEVAPARIRGRLVSLNQLAIVGGMVVVYFVNSRIAQSGDDAWNQTYGWRWMFGSGALPAVVFQALLFLVPESPRWLTKQGREDQAMAVLSRVSGLRQAQAQMAEIRDSIAHEVQPSTSWLWFLLGGLAGVALVEFLLTARWAPLWAIAATLIELNPIVRMTGCFLVGGMLLKGLATFSQRHFSEYRRPGWIAVILAVLQQITGINVVLYYAPEIFKTAGLKATQAISDTVIVGVVNAAFTLVAIGVVDRLGRKPLLLIGSLGMGISLGLLGGAFYLEEFQGRWVLLFTLAYVASFAMAMGPVVWVLMAEIFPTGIRGRAMSIATVCLWISCYLVSQTFPWMLEQLGGAFTFWFYAVICGVALAFVAAFVPETKGKTLEEIERSWKR